MFLTTTGIFEILEAAEKLSKLSESGNSSASSSLDSEQLKKMDKKLGAVQELQNKTLDGITGIQSTLDEVTEEKVKRKAVIQYIANTRETLNEIKTSNNLTQEEKGVFYHFFLEDAANSKLTTTEEYLDLLEVQNTRELRNQINEFGASITGSLDELSKANVRSLRAKVDEYQGLIAKRPTGKIGGLWRPGAFLNVGVMLYIVAFLLGLFTVYGFFTVSGSWFFIGNLVVTAAFGGITYAVFYVAGAAYREGDASKTDILEKMNINNRLQELSADIQENMEYLKKYSGVTKYFNHG